MGAMRARQGIVDGETDPVPTCRVVGSCLWLDLAGFSKLTDHATSRGPSGIESLSVTLGRLYATIEEVVRVNSGELLFIAGDGALCCWRRDDFQLASDVAFAASTAALALRGALAQRVDGGFRPSLRQIVLTGDWQLHRLGADTSHSALPLFTGRVLNQLARLTHVCASDQILLTERSARLLGSLADAPRVAPGAHSLRRLVTPRTKRLETQGATSTIRTSLGQWLGDERLSSRALRAAGAELRRVSVLYVRLPPGTRAPIHALHELAKDIQQAATQDGGHVYQLVHDDKGIVFLLAFGLPGQSRGEDALAALLCALRVADHAHLRGLYVGIGISTGTVYCGPVGDLQRHYFLLGNPVIRAARLAALDERTPLVDAETYRLTARWFEFEELGLRQLKGTEYEIAVYRSRRARRAIMGPLRFVGRNADQAQLRARLERFAAAGEAHSIVVQGDIGVGKTALLSRLPLWAARLGLPCFTHAAEALDSQVPYLGVRPLFQAVLGLTDVGGPTLPIERLLDTVPDARELAALLNPLTIAQYPTSRRVELMTPSARREQRIELVGRLFSRRLSDRAVVIVVDDTQWLDASSIELIEHLRRRLPRVLWVLSERAVSSPADRLETLFQGSERLILEPLESPDVGLLIEACAKVERLDGGLLEAVQRAAQGNPLHTLELVRELLSGARAYVDAGTLRLRDGVSRGLVSVPASLEDLIQGRFDRLTRPAREVLRAASVLGTSFEAELVRQLLDARLAPSTFDAGLAELAAEGMVVRVEDYRFAHASVQAVVYGLLPPSEQRTLHARAAAALEMHYATRLPAVAARLAYHLGSAQLFAKATQFSALAAEQALMGYAHADAIRLFRQALDQAEQARGRVGVDVQRARWSASLAQALYSESRHEEARAAYQLALSWTACAPPGQDGRALARNLLSLAWDGLLHRARRARPALAPAPTRARYLAAMHIMHASGPLDLWDGKILGAANKALAAYRLAAHVGVAREAAEAVADIGYMLASTPARERAFRLLRRGVKLADLTGDLEARTSTRVLTGMALTGAGRAAEAEAPLRDAQALALRLGSGLWRHRAAFIHAEALLFCGKLREAELGFEVAARLAAEAEPPVEGLSNCMRSLALARAGRVSEAAELAAGERGAALTRGHCMVLQRFTSYGICAELLARAQRLEEAVAAAETAFQLANSERHVSVFLAGLHGHAGVVSCLLMLLERAVRHDVRGLEPARLRARLRVAARRLRHFGRLYTAAMPRASLLLGHVAALNGRDGGAHRSWKQAAAAARRTGQRYELELALRALASGEKKGEMNVRTCI